MFRLNVTKWKTACTVPRLLIKEQCNDFSIGDNILEFLQNLVTGEKKKHGLFNDRNWGLYAIKWHSE